MSHGDQRPPIGIAHVVMHTNRMEDSARFMRTVDMRPEALLAFACESMHDAPTRRKYFMKASRNLQL